MSNFAISLIVQMTFAILKWVLTDDNFKNSVEESQTPDALRRRLLARIHAQSGGV